MAKKPRIELPFAAWPARDRAAWDALFHEGNPLDGQGAAVHWAEATRTTNRKHYARWLGWLAANGLLAPDEAPYERARPERVEAYARDLIARVAPRTAASALIGLKCMLIRMHPDVDWRWLKAMTNRLDRWAPPAREYPALGLTAADMFARLLAELERLARGPLTKRRDQILFRDTLIVALLVSCPIRLRNLAMMEIGRHLSISGKEWHLRFDSAETKTGHPVHLVVPPELAPWLAFFFDRIRPTFPGAAGGAHVWPACKGRPMACETIYASVVKHTFALFGVALSPHAFRSLAATALAESSPRDALYARPLLGHRQPGTTERHYIRANQMEAARNVTAALRQNRDN